MHDASDTSDVPTYPWQGFVLDRTEPVAVNGGIKALSFEAFGDNRIDFASRFPRPLEPVIAKV